MTETTRPVEAPQAARKGGHRGDEQQGSLSAARQRLASLYPVSNGRGVSFRTAAAGAFFVAAATALSLARVGGPGALDSMWAEDGAIFYQGTFQHSLLSALFTPNNGYLEFLPRFLIGLISYLPVSRAAAAISLSGALISSGLALLVYHASAEHFRSRVPRAGLAVLAALPAYGAGEIANNIVNLQWFLLYATFWMFLWNPQAVGRRAVAAVVLFVAAASDPVPTLFLTPLLFLRLGVRPWRDSRWQVGGLALGLAYQGVAVLRGQFGSRTNLPSDFSLTFAGRSYGHDVLANSLVSRAELVRLGLGDGAAEGIGVVVLVLAIVGAAVLFRTRGLFAALCLATSVALFALLAMVGGSSLPRYAAVPALLLITACAVLVDGQRLGRVPIVAFCVLLAVNLGANYSVGTDQPRAQTTGWFAQVKDGKHACKQDPTIGSVKVQTAPGLRFKGSTWYVAVPCSALVSGAKSAS